MSSSRQSTPPANNMLTLASDLLAMRAKQLLTALAHSGWGPADQLQSALDTYEQVRVGDAITEAQDDPQKCTVANWEPAPQTKRSARS